MPDGEAFYLHPGQLALAVTYESVTLPADIVGWLDGRSSLARLGLMGTSPPTASIRAGPVASCWSFTTAASCLWPASQDEDRCPELRDAVGVPRLARTTNGKMPNTRVSKGCGQPDQPGLIHAPCSFYRGGCQGTLFNLTKRKRACRVG